MPADDALDEARLPELLRSALLPIAGPAAEHQGQAARFAEGRGLLVTGPVQRRQFVQPVLRQADAAAAQARARLAELPYDSNESAKLSAQEGVRSAEARAAKARREAADAAADLAETRKGEFTAAKQGGKSGGGSASQGGGMGAGGGLGGVGSIFGSFLKDTFGIGDWLPALDNLWPLQAADTLMSAFMPLGVAAANGELGIQTPGWYPGMSEEEFTALKGGQTSTAPFGIPDIAAPPMPANGQHITNVILATENLADHLTHFYLFFMPDFTRPVYAPRPWFAEANRRFAALAGEHARAAVAARQRWFEIMGTLGGKWPHTQSVQPGGSARPVEAAERIRLLAKLPTIAAYSYKKSVGQPFLYPDNSLSLVENFLRMTFGLPAEPYEPDPEIVRALDMLLILHADHEQNCSTSTVRLVGSSQANLFTSISGGINALWGPLHGGANQSVLEMLETIRVSGGDVSEFVRKVKNREDGVKLMGFGHRVYKNFDPRATIIKNTAYEVFDVTGKSPLLDIALKLEEVALADNYFVDRKLYPNVDFYSGLIYQAMGFPMDMFTVLFAIPRVAGWLSHYTELLEQDQRIIRPRQIYVGAGERDYVPFSIR